MCVNIYLMKRDILVLVVFCFILLLIFPIKAYSYSSPGLTTVNQISYGKNHGLFPIIGDINGDGYPDMISGDGTYNSNNGILYVNFGNKSSFNTTPELIITSSISGLEVFAGPDYGEHIAVGDIDNNGFDDILSASILNDDGVIYHGRVYLFYGKSTLSGNITTNEADLTGMSDEATRQFFGDALSIFDTDNDGFEDVVIVDATTNNATSSIIKTYLNSNGSIDLNTPNYSLTTSNTNYTLYSSKLFHGDFNGDLNEDIFTCSRYLAGKCHIFLGSGTGEFTQSATFNPVLTSYHLGRNGSIDVGDINNDGKDDFCVGEHRNGVLGTDQGRVYCFFGRSSFNASYSVADANIILNGAAAKDSFGRSLFLYDVTNDGYPDLLVGAHQQYQDSGSWHGKFYIYKNSDGTFNDSPWLSEIKTSGNAVYGLGVAATDADLDGWADILVTQPHDGNGNQISIVNHYEISHGNPVINIDSQDTTKVGENITGTATNTDTNYNISGVEWKENSSSSWTSCTPNDGSFNSSNEKFSCNTASLSGQEGVRINIRLYDQNYIYLPNVQFRNIDFGPSSTTTSTTPEIYQISQEVLSTTTTETVLTPIKDSSTGETNQKVVAIIKPQTFDFNAYLSSNVDTNTFPKINTDKDGNIISQPTINTSIGRLTRISNVSEIWYKAYPPEGYQAAKIIPELQKKPSILSLSYTGTYKNLKIAHSLDGKIWKILPNSVMDTKNKTVATITKIGGYYTLVSPSYTTKTVLGETTEKTSPVPNETPKITNNEITKNKEAIPVKQSIFSLILDKISKLFKN